MCYVWNHELYLFFSIVFSFHLSGKAYSCFSLSRDLVPELGRLSSKSNLADSFLSLFHLQVSPLCLHSSLRKVLTWLDLAKRFFFFYQGLNSAIIHFSWLLWSSRCFDVAEETIALLLFNNVNLATPKVTAVFLIAWFCCFIPDISFLHLRRHLFARHVESSHDQLPNADLTLKLYNFLCS